MEQKSPKADETSRGHESLSYQRRMWKNFQGKTKPWLSPKLGSERRGAGGAEGSKKESGLWMFKRKKKPLDRVFSSSQPNLCCSTPAPFAGDACVGSSAGDGMMMMMVNSDGQTLGAASGAAGSKPELTAHGSPKLAVSQLMLYQQKSSSLGSACFEKLVMDPNTGMSEEEQLRKNASDSVSKEQHQTHICQLKQYDCVKLHTITETQTYFFDSTVFTKRDKFHVMLLRHVTAEWHGRFSSLTFSSAS